MRFNLDNDGSPGTMVSLLLGRAVAKPYPDAKDIIRITLRMSQRNALHVPPAHQSLIGAFLEYKDKMRDWPLERLGAAYWGEVMIVGQNKAAVQAGTVHIPRL